MWVGLASKHKMVIVWGAFAIYELTQGHAAAAAILLGAALIAAAIR